MIIEPTLLGHPKFTVFQRALGRRGGDALSILVRLWAHCQADKRGEAWGKVPASYVEAVADWKGAKGALFSVLTEELIPSKKPWITLEPDGEVRISSWNDHNKSLLANWFRNPGGGSNQPTATPWAPRQD